MALSMPSVRGEWPPGLCRWHRSRACASGAGPHSLAAAPPALPSSVRRRCGVAATPESGPRRRWHWTAPSVCLTGQPRQRSLIDRASAGDPVEDCAKVAALLGDEVAQGHRCLAGGPCRPRRVRCQRERTADDVSKAVIGCADELSGVISPTSSTTIAVGMSDGRRVTGHEQRVGSPGEDADDDDAHRAVGMQRGERDPGDGHPDQVPSVRAAPRVSRSRDPGAATATVSGIQ